MPSDSAPEIFFTTIFHFFSECFCIDRETHTHFSLHNFFISERIKHNHYNGSYTQSYFWRTTRQQEVDYIEIENGEISAFEMKWNPNKKGTPLPKTFEETYSPKQSIVVTPENFYEWV